MLTETKTALFGILCESILTESTIINLLGSSPRSIALAKFLHQNGMILHTSQFQKKDSIVKNLPGRQARINHHYILKGENNDFLYLETKGARGGVLEVTYVNPDSTLEHTEYHTVAGANRYIKSKIGKIKEIYNYNTTTDTGAEKKHREHIISRKAAKKEAEKSIKVTQEQIIKKFKPLFMRTLRTAESEIKGMLMTMIRNGYYVEAHRKAETLKGLGDIIDNLEQGYESMSSGQQDWMRNRVVTAINLTAQYLYPDITKGFGYGGSLNSYEGVNKLMDSLSEGNTRNLAIILRFFKNCVMRVI